MLFITPWERDALRLVAHNGTNADVAACLGIDARDVGSRLAELFSRMGMSNRADALDCACRRGLLDPDSPKTQSAPTGSVAFHSTVARML